MWFVNFIYLPADERIAFSCDEKQLFVSRFITMGIRECMRYVSWEETGCKKKIKKKGKHFLEQKK